MRIKAITLATFLLFAGVGMSASMAVAAAADKSASATVEGFDFNYSLDLGSNIGLVQVFDDGDRTYFQFADMENLPKVYMVSKSGKSTPAKLEAKPPYLIASGIANRYILKTPKKATNVNYLGQRRPEVTAQVEDMPAERSVEAAPAPAPVKQSPKKVKKVVREDYSDDRDRFESSDSRDQQDEGSQENGQLVQGTVLNVPFFENSVTISKKSRLDLQQRLSDINKSSQVIVRGRPSAQGDKVMARTRALALKEFLVESGVDEDLIQVATNDKAKDGKNSGFYLSEIILVNGGNVHLNNGNSKSTAKRKYQIRAGEKISESMSAWCKANNWTLAWDAQESVAEADVALGGNFDHAIEAVLDALNRGGANLRATFYDANRVVRISEQK